MFDQRTPGEGLHVGEEMRETNMERTEEEYSTQREVETCSPCPMCARAQQGLVS
jgi:hypothetical protein